MSVSESLPVGDSYQTLMAVDGVETGKQVSESLTLSNFNLSADEYRTGNEALGIGLKDPIVQSAHSKLLEIGDENTVAHLKRSAIAAFTLANRILEVSEASIIPKRLGITEVQLETLRNLRPFVRTVLCHDVGESRKDINSLIKLDRRLFSNEQEVVDEHAALGADFIDSSDWDTESKLDSSTLVRLHHSLRPNHPVGRPVTGRLQILSELLAYTDQADALGSDRPYKKSLPAGAVRPILENEFRGEYLELFQLVAFDMDELRKYSSSINVSHIAVARALKAVNTAS